MLRCLSFIKSYITRLVLILVFFAIAKSAGPKYSSRIVETESGSIRGIIVELNSRHLEPVEVFRGVPYAAPPMGERRFSSPIPPDPWTGTRLADTFSPVCPQRLPDISNKTVALANMPRGRYLQLRRLLPLLINQSEDCLYLNLYVPGSGNRGLQAPYAVIVFVHGESYEWNAGNPYEGSVLASFGHVIMVTLNFRLGILGFLRTQPGPDKPKTSGENLGVQDIAAALLWIQKNIASFGGDPKRVTLMGHDTGAALVNILLLTSSAKTLFHRAILLSGCILSPWAVVQQPNYLRSLVADQLRCRIGPGDDLAPCLRKKALSELMNIQFDPPRFQARFGPSSPRDASSADPVFAMEHASEAFVTRELVLGTATTESYLDFNAAEIQYGFEEDQRNRVLRTYIRNAYVYHLNEIFSTVKNEYTDWDKPILHPINIRDSTLEALSDGHTVSPLVRVGYLHARRGAKTYFFHFGYQSKESDYPQRLGSVRGEAFTYILGLPLVGGLPFFPQKFTKQDVAVAEAVLNFFTNFAKSGDPNEPKIEITSDFNTLKEKSRYRGFTWESYEIQNQQYLSITLKPKMKSHYRGHKMSIWLNLIPQLHQPGSDDVSMRHHHFHERAERFYQGIIQSETQTRPPPPYLPQNPRLLTTTLPECAPNATEETNAFMDDETAAEAGILQQIIDDGHRGYAAALSATVGVGCLLLVLNLFIFAGIYYQRVKNRRPRTRSCWTGNVSETSTEISRFPEVAQEDHAIKLLEPPPCYTSIVRTPIVRDSLPLPQRRYTSVAIAMTLVSTNNRLEHEVEKMTKEGSFKILVLGPSKTGKTSICNVLSDLSETTTRANRPTKGVRIIEFVVPILSSRNNSSQKAEIELWDCGGECEKFWPALRQGADGFVLVYSQNTMEQKKLLMKIYNYFVEDSNASDGNCIVFFNALHGKDDSVKLHENPLQGLDHVTIDLENEDQELKKIFELFIKNLMK